jgi:signal transduction histidine kinase
MPDNVLTPLPPIVHPDGIPLRAFLARLVWACVLPLVLLAAYLAFDQVRTARAHQNLEAANLAKNVATSIDQALGARTGALQILAISPHADNPTEWADLYQEALGFRESFGGQVIFAGVDLRMRFNTRVPLGTPLGPLPRPGGRAAAPAALETGKPAIGDVFTGPVANEPLVAIAVPGLRQGKVAFLVLTSLEARLFQARLDEVALPAGWMLTLKDGNGSVIARRGGHREDAAADAEPAGSFVAGSALSPWSVALEIPRDVYDAPVLSAAIALALAILGATLAGVVGGMHAGRRLARAVASLAQTRRPDAPVHDIAEIAAARRLLDDAARKREAAEADLEHRIFERTAELEAANRELVAFDYSVSHDLRAPLNRIRGFGDALVEGFADGLPPEGKDLVKRIQASGEDVDRLVTAMQSLATIARGEVDRSDVDLSAMARGILDSFGRAEPGRRVQTVVHPDLRAPADHALLRLALENLLANAWKFTSHRDEARIEFGCEPASGAPCYFVRDNGAGFDAAMAGKLFQPFRRLHAQDEFPGTGIGLAIVQRIVRRHGGWAWAQGAVGEGATFHFTL